MSGCVKIVESISRCESRKEIFNKKTENCLVLSYSNLHEFYEELLKDTQKKLITKNLAVNLIHSLAKELFSKERSLNSLLNSLEFFFELYKLFSKFSENLITPDEIRNIINTLAPIDYARMVIITDLYEKYLTTLDENNLVTTSTAPENLYEIATTDKDFLLIDAPEGISPAHKKLFEKLFKQTTVYTVNNNKPPSNTTYCAIIFDELKQEIEFLASKIKSEVQAGNKYSDYGIFVSNQTLKNRITDIFKSQNIPIDPEGESDDYKNFKNALIRYFNIFLIFQKLELKNLSKEEFERLNYDSRAFLEAAYEELNIHIESMLNELAPKSKDKFMSLTENSGFLLQIINTNLEMADNSEKDLLKKMLEDIRKYYGAFQNNKITGIISSVAENYNQERLKKPLGILISSVKETVDFYENVINTRPDLNVIIELIKGSREETQEKQNKKECVKIEPLTSSQKYKYVLIPSLTEEVLPSANSAINFISPQSEKILTDLLKNKYAQFDYLIKPDELHNENERKKFINALSCANESIVVTTHSYEDKKQSNPSPYFQEVVNLTNIIPQRVEQNEKELKSETCCQSEQKIENTKVITDDEILKLNPSSIRNYQNCPRKFYFKNLLNLKEQSVFAANYGTIVHAIFEVLNKKGQNFYNKETCLVLKNILFNSVQEPQSAIEAGFKQIDIDLINATDKLSLREMENNFEDAIKNLEMSGFFISKPESIRTETSFHFKTEIIKNVVFDGRIDAITQNGEKYSLIDYKTGADRENDLEYEISDNGVNFLTKTGKVPANPKDYQNKYDYQIPIYYIACENAPELKEFKGKLERLGLQYIRPSSKNGGCKSDMIEADKISEKQEKILSNLKNTIIDKIRNTTYFEKEENWNCSECAFKFLCDNEESSYD